MNEKPYREYRFLRPAREGGYTELVLPYWFDPKTARQRRDNERVLKEKAREQWTSPESNKAQRRKDWRKLKQRCKKMGLTRCETFGNPIEF